MEGKEMKILIFSLNGEHYATDIGDVERILGYIESTEMPDVPDFVEGVINYENNILPILNLSKKFNFPIIKNQSEQDQKKIIVVKRNDKKFGVIVDTVYEVSDVSNSLFEEPPAITASASKNYIEGLIKLNDKIVILLNLDKILSDEEEELIF
ncbi:MULTISPECIES: chemotaxis protein CheW [Clostridium]|uniref:Purine-binding chemotaxis protein CheW n=1 Tax=Clostridium cibarium TaxID=2762247 RepID=A0ABR8PNW5_9CLOT|nr:MULTISPECIES: chemotaxis protein CheW [Clostridium]MBD7909874.1 purine-binding chemotaxis protein CheW [Clostridium cibarium]